MTERDSTYPVPERYREGTAFDSDTHVELHRADPRLSSLEEARALAQAAANAEMGASPISAEEFERRRIEIAEVKSRNIVKAFRSPELPKAA